MRQPFGLIVGIWGLLCAFWRSLWRPAGGGSSPSPRPETIPATQSPEELLVLGASVVGEDHIRHGIPCQDAHGWCTLPDGTQLLVVADGMGSYRFAHLGSAAAVCGALEAAARHCVDRSSAVAESPTERQARAVRLLRSLLTCARRAVEQLAAAEGHRLRELATTLLICLRTEDCTVAAQVGDGGAVVDLGPERGWQVLSVPHEREHANETNSITDDQWEETVHISVVEGRSSAVVLMTDGCDWAALRRRKHRIAAANGAVSITTRWEPAAEFLEAVRAGALQSPSPQVGSAELARFLASDAMSREWSDDKTMLMLIARAERGAS